MLQCMDCLLNIFRNIRPYGIDVYKRQVWGQRGASYEVCYSTTKGAIDSFTKALAKELAPSNIQVNAVSCGIIDTKMNGHLTQEDVDSIIEEIPASRLGTTEDVANAVYGLVNSGSYVTGDVYKRQPSIMSLNISKP